MSDVELDAEEMSQDEMETENVEGVHKKTGEVHKCKLLEWKTWSRNSFQVSE